MANQAPYNDRDAEGKHRVPSFKSASTPTLFTKCLGERLPTIRQMPEKQRLSP
ncbi:MAG: hypothetical protein LBQ50_02355 [Planctomycetaceae bacterium]|nr:hypothetical protein [Planctomycetaceae bacterium]